MLKEGTKNRKNHISLLHLRKNIILAMFSQMLFSSFKHFMFKYACGYIIKGNNTNLKLDYFLQYCLNDYKGVPDLF